MCRMKMMVRVVMMKKKEEGGGRREGEEEVTVKIFLDKFFRIVSEDYFAFCY